MIYNVLFNVQSSPGVPKAGVSTLLRDVGTDGLYLVWSLHSLAWRCDQQGIKDPIVNLHLSPTEIKIYLVLLRKGPRGGGSLLQVSEPWMTAWALFPCCTVFFTFTEALHEYSLWSVEKEETFLSPSRFFWLV